MKCVIYISVLLLGVTLISGCESLLEPTPRGQIALDQLLTTEEGLITAVNGVYQPLHTLYEGNVSRLTDMASDDGWTWRKETEPDIFIVDQTFNVSQSVWTDLYTGITRANTVLSRMDGVSEFSDAAVREAIEGQAKFMRAFYYFNLVRFFGGVPLILQEIKTRSDAEQARATIEEVYVQIKSDLDDASRLLPDSYPGNTGMEVGRPTSYAAHALRSLVHLELEEWTEAAAAAQTVISNTSLGLLPNYAANFNGSQENGHTSLFEVQYGGVTAATTTAISNFFAPPDLQGGASILPSDDNLEGKGGSLSSGNGLVQAFEPGDTRRDIVLKNYGLANFIDPSKPDGSLYFVNKFYNTNDPVGLSTWNFPLIRYGEMLLVRAEALNEIDYIADGEAFNLLNTIRLNAGLSARTVAELPDQEAFREALRKERRIELCFEAKRFHDLNRWGILRDRVQVQMDYLGLDFPTQKTIEHPITGKEYYLYPIPSIEFVNNAQLGEQNPGY
ncbi:RagB/SusD family nutrient uptake outer membrane protein [Parapedobacter indicus]|uniref:Starch-binding associating with outer membrane n=1 Tax=Parapedobacter indicus TaxID=1477437 RepID=A0A1I3FE64_9SPHI|nr:RagB/SusD family nutrient uptake outer membrane protein [Parapedobacter indicus]PPL03682.1 putative outer membrane starch-binding protein [Parapedobacter indicus]SFI09523.1 Starch-binding associating with outer membrane [Parapedobacter indicus]